MSKRKKLTYNELLNAVHGRCSKLEETMMYTMRIIDRSYAVINEYIEFKHDTPKFLEHLKMKQEASRKKDAENKKSEKKVASEEK